MPLIILTIVILSTGGMLFSYALRGIIYHYAFYGMSKTRKRKIIRAQSRSKRVIMLYATKYNNRGRTWWCIICYYVFCIGWASFTGAAIACLFFDDVPGSPWVDLGYIALITLFICMFSVFIPFKNKSYKIPKNPQ